ncbi:hypothetical protein VTO42DRAFT_4752 [Malbranchea cinnamomea]
MFASNPLRHHDRERISPDALGHAVPPTRAADDQLTVSGVFAPRAREYEKRPGDTAAVSLAVCKDDNALKIPFVGFRMQTPESSPTRGNGEALRVGQSPSRHNNQSSTGRKKKKKKRDPADKGMETSRPEDNGVRAHVNVSANATSPSVTHFAGGNKGPVVRSNGGVSALKQQLESLNLASQGPESSCPSSELGSQTPSNASSDSDSDQTEVLTTYEVPLEHDFISPDAENREMDASQSTAGQHRKDLLHRKMTAADFEPITCLGKGTYGTVLLVRHKQTGILYAQKQFTKASLIVHKKLVEQTKTERTILESVNRHPFVVKLFYAFQDNEKLYLILEYAQGGELFTHLAMERMFSEDVAAFYMAEMVLALEHLHHNVGVIYRDLKPENCLLDAEGHLLLTDFGLSKVAVDGEDRCNSSLGTIEYMAPEVVQGKPYGKACDWWSLGALGFDLLTGSPPFKGNNHAKIIEKILKQKLILPYFLSPDAKDLLTRLLRKDPSKRLGYHMPKDMKIIKSHRFFRKIDWKALERRELEPPIRPVITDPALAENFSSDFTSLPLSPLVSKKSSLFRDERHDSRGVSCHGHDVAAHDDPFGGFSFVAPSSLLESEFCWGNRGR